MGGLAIDDVLGAGTSLVTHVMGCRLQKPTGIFGLGS